MFNLSFGELLIIGTVGILVIGPARLPETARFLGHFIGRIQRQVSAVKSDIRREMALEDMKNIHREYETAARDMQNSIRQVGDDIQKTADDAVKEASAGDAKSAEGGAPAAVENTGGAENANAAPAAPAAPAAGEEKTA